MIKRDPSSWTLKHFVAAIAIAAAIVAAAIAALPVVAIAAIAEAIRSQPRHPMLHRWPRLTVAGLATAPGQLRTFARPMRH